MMRPHFQHGKSAVGRLSDLFDEQYRAAQPGHVPRPAQVRQHRQVAAEHGARGPTGHEHLSLAQAQPLRLAAERVPAVTITY